MNFYTYVYNRIYFCGVKALLGCSTGLKTFLFTVAGLDQSNRKVHYAHRSVLAAASAYFNAMFTSDVLEAKRERIVIQSLDGLTLASLLDFMYTGTHED